MRISLFRTSRHILTTYNILYLSLYIIYILRVAKVSLALHWHCVGIALALHWHCIGCRLSHLRVLHNGTGIISSTSSLRTWRSWIRRRAMACGMLPVGEMHMLPSDSLVAGEDSLTNCSQVESQGSLCALLH